jgi:hypothetical protein
MSLVTVLETRALVQTDLSDDQLQEVIDRVEAEIIARIGAPQDDDGSVQITKRLQGGTDNVYLPVEIGEVVSVVEDGLSLIADEYRVWAGGVLERLPGGVWGQLVVVTFKPADDRPQRKAAIIDLVRLDVNRTAMARESIAGEYAYDAPANWEAERRRIIRRLTFTVAG